MDPHNAPVFEEDLDFGTNPYYVYELYDDSDYFQEATRILLKSKYETLFCNKYAKIFKDDVFDTLLDHATTVSKISAELTGYLLPLNWIAVYDYWKLVAKIAGFCHDVFQLGFISFDELAHWTDYNCAKIAKDVTVDLSKPLNHRIYSFRQNINNINMIGFVILLADACDFLDTIMDAFDINKNDFNKKEKLYKMLETKYAVLDLRFAENIPDLISQKIIFYHEIIPFLYNKLAHSHHVVNILDDCKAKFSLLGNFALQYYKMKNQSDDSGTEQEELEEAE